MTCIIDAVFENGLLRPLGPLEGVREHSHVRLTVESIEPDSTGVTDIIGILPDADAAEMRAIIEAEFERVDPRDW